MTKLWDIPGYTRELYREMKDEGYIRVRFHPEYPLGIVNYSDKTQIDRMWNPVTLNSRGLIFDVFTDEIVARPFKKFFNYGEKEAAEIPLEAQVVVTDKADGSLGIIYPTPEGYAVATRGSFESEQAIKATEILQIMEFEFESYITYLVEIIYPENRIVLDYGAEEKLVLLGGVTIHDGRPHSASLLFFNGDWSGEIIQSFPYSTLAEALAAPPRKNAEGLVVRSIADGSMVKLKQEDYIKLHRLVTGLNERVVWEYMKDHDGDYRGLLEGLPDEFHSWVIDKGENFRLHFNGLHYYVCNLYSREGMSPEHPERWDRKGFAEWANSEENKPYRAYLFMLLDGKDIGGMIWKSLRPVGVTQQMRAQSEDVA